LVDGDTGSSASSEENAGESGLIKDQFGGNLAALKEIQTARW
jgi:hypothetical protein